MFVLFTINIIMTILALIIASTKGLKGGSKTAAIMLALFLPFVGLVYAIVAQGETV